MGKPDTRQRHRRPIWRRLIPARVRLQAGLIMVSALTIGLTVLCLGSFQVRPIVFSSQVLEPPSITYSIVGEADLFEPSVAHAITIDVSDVEYKMLVSDFQASGDKTWIRADAMIDGTRVGSVGIRLKGNSTLRSLRGPDGAGAFPGPPGGRPPNRGPPPAGMPHSVPPTSTHVATAPKHDRGATEGRGAGPPMSSASFEAPSSLPLLMSVDRFVRGRGYQGRAELAIRPIVGEGAGLNEATALRLIAESGQASQAFTWVRFRMNGGEETTRLVLENPDQNYAAALKWGAGALYKSRSTNSFTYKGEDHSQYVDDFAQISAVGSLDLAPVIGLLKFLRDASDEQLDAELPHWVDVQSFARYVATHDLLNNFDDMAGPGRNFLLWFDASTRRFTVISWDMNLAISGMGAGRGPKPPDGAAPSGFAPPGFAPPGAAPPGGPPQAGGAHAGRPPMAMGNRLKERFMASETFAPIIERAKDELRAEWFDSGRAVEIVRELSELVPRTNQLSDSQIEDEAAALTVQLEALAAAARGE